MKPLITLISLLALLLFPTDSRALDAQSQIKAVLDTQVEAWNRGDLSTFVTTYADDCIFVGKQVTEGNAQLLDRYKKTYPTPAAMGHLTFSDLAIHLLGKDVAFVTSKWHLDRSVDAGGPTGGVFSLVLHRKNGLWKIALDHTA